MHYKLFSLSVALAASVQAAPQFTTSPPPQQSNVLPSDLVAPGVFPSWNVIPSGITTHPINPDSTLPSLQSSAPAPIVNNSLGDGATTNAPNSVPAVGIGDQQLATTTFVSPASGNKFALVSSAAGFTYSQAQATCTQIGSQLADLGPSDLLVIAANVQSLAYIGSINGNAYGGSVCFAWMPQMFTGIYDRKHF